MEKEKKPNKPTHTKTTTKIPTPLNKTEKKPKPPHTQKQYCISSDDSVRKKGSESAFGTMSVKVQIAKESTVMHF